MSSSPVEFSIATKSASADTFRDRRPPWSEDAERAVLAAMILSVEAIVTAAELVTEDMFYREGHRRLFRAMMAVHAVGAVVDPLTLSNELEQRGDLVAAGGKEYIGGLLDEVPTAANVEHHCRIVSEKALRRRLIETATNLVREGHESPADTAELLDLAEHKILELNDSRGNEGFVKIKSLLWSAMERIEQLRTAGGTLTGVPSGFKDLDQMTLGFQPSDLVIVAARPSMGKTAFVLNVAQYAAIEANVPTAIFSLEMSTESLLMRMLASEGYVDAQRLRSGALTAQDASNLEGRGPAGAGAHLDRRHAGPQRPGAPLPGPAPQVAGGHPAHHRRLPAAHHRARELREPAAGSLDDLPLAEGPREGAEGAGTGPVAAVARLRATRR
jgi:replicative DNA helicase